MSAVKQSEDNHKLVNLPQVRSEEKECGKPSKLWRLCNKALEQGRKECVLLCYQRRGKYLARIIDFCPEKHHFEIADLKYTFGFLRRFSLKAPISIKEVKVRIVPLFGPSYS